MDEARDRCFHDEPGHFLCPVPGDELVRVVVVRWDAGCDVGQHVGPFSAFVVGLMEHEDELCDEREEQDADAEQLEDEVEFCERPVVLCCEEHLDEQDGDEGGGHGGHEDLDGEREGERRLELQVRVERERAERRPHGELETAQGDLAYALSVLFTNDAVSFAYVSASIPAYKAKTAPIPTRTLTRSPPARPVSPARSLPP